MKFKDYFEEDLYKAQNTEEIRAIQISRLQKRMGEFYLKSPMVKMLLDANKVDPANITLEQFRSTVPVRVQRDTAPSAPAQQTTVAKTMAGLCGVSENDFVLLCSTSGTTGEPSPYFFTEEDLEATARGLSRTLWMVAGGSEDEIRQFRVIQAFALSMVGAGVPAIEAFIRLGIPVIPVGAEGGTEKIFFFTEKMGGNLLFSTPSLAEHLLDTDAERSKELGLKRIMCGAEPGAGIPEVRKKIEEGYGCPLTDAMGLVWGLMWVSCDLPEYAGMHYLSDDMHFIDLVDPETQEAVDFEDGAVGQLVMTPLTGSMPPIRTAPGDSVQIFTEPCACGAPGWRMKVVGRTDDMLKVKGVVVFPAALDSVITGFVPRVTGEFRIVLDQPPPKVEPPLKLKVEYGEKTEKGDLSKLAKEISETMHRKLKVRPEIEWLAPMSLERSTYKTRFIEKTYEKK